MFHSLCSRVNLHRCCIWHGLIFMFFAIKIHNFLKFGAAFSNHSYLTMFGDHLTENNIFGNDGRQYKIVELERLRCGLQAWNKFSIDVIISVLNLNNSENRISDSIWHPSTTIIITLLMPLSQMCTLQEKFIPEGDLLLFERKLFQYQSSRNKLN